MMSNPSPTGLFDMNEVLLDSPRMTLLKKYDIQTHFCEDEDLPWLAIPMKEARVLAKDYDPSREYPTLFDVCASICIILDDEGLLFYAESKEDAENMALAHAMKGGSDE